MIIQITNNDKKFYDYMGKFFGSRIVQNETKDRIYDDNNKTWYVYLNKQNKPCAFVSLCENVIKNVYTNRDEYLEEILVSLNNTMYIKDSIVTKTYEDIYVKCGFNVSNLNNYKHFIMIRGEKNNA